MGSANRLGIWGIAVLTGWVAAMGATTVSAAPVIRIQARTEIKLDPILRRAGQIIVRGRLSDRASDEPVQSERVWVELDTMQRRTLTGNDGRFEVRFPATTGKHRLTVNFSGTHQYSTARIDIRDFDATKNPLTLSVTVARELPYPAKDVTATIRAESSGSGVPIAVKVILTEPESIAGDPKRHVLPVTTTGANGEATITLPVDKLGQPGRKLLLLRFDGDESYDAARASAELLLVTATALTAKLVDDDISFEASAELRGKLVDNAGAGLSLGRINVYRAGKRLGQTITDERGEFAVDIPAKRIGAGKQQLSVRFEPSRSWRRASSAKILDITIGEAKPVPVGYTLAAFGATAIALIAFVGLRAKPWRNWAWLARLRRETDEDPSPPGADGRPPLQTGLQLARPSLVSTLRRAHENNFAGVVRDAVTGRPLAGATIELMHTGDGHAATTTAGDGSFQLAELEHGPWRANVSCHGYCTERFPVTVPHRGELSGVRIDLLPVRERIFELYRMVAQPLLPESRLWGIWTPRQIVDYVRANRPRPALALLTDFVEESYFSQRTHSEQVLVRTAAMVEAAARE